MVRLMLTLAYVGAKFHGWQLQADARTVQGCLEQALTRLAGCQVRVHGAGRTDAGVHALGQVAHADIPAARADLPWQRALNALLPTDIAVIRVVPVRPAFHARFDAVGKTYSYTLWTEPGYLLPQRKDFVWSTGPLDQALMTLAAQELVGRRNWSAFQNRGTAVRSPVRTVYDLHCEAGMRPEETIWLITADGFLKQMVRNIMGCLVMVGKRKLAVEEVLKLAEQRQRQAAPATAPAQGLCLEKVVYGRVPSKSFL
ncbi:MAG TPA: tRNA pseudouridine(38-40) synthase TruA [Desulfonatronum sp.]|nr:tRNA pseudouridine(38-40) synthase TruA [Desulfonatronum sp.]